MGTGYILAKKNKLDKPCADQLTFLLCYIIMPCVIFSAFQVDFDPVMFHNLLIVAAMTVLIHFGFILAAHLLFNKKTAPSDTERCMLRFSSIYSNCGFMGFPLLSTLIGMQGVFYGSVYNGFFGIFLWTHGFLLYAHRLDFRAVLRVLVNPNIIVIAIGIPLYINSVHLPLSLTLAMQHLAELNTALSMLVIGATMTNLPLSDLFSNPRIWFCVLLRNFIFPGIVLCSLHALRINQDLLLSLTILSACPTAGVAVLFARLTGKDPVFPGKALALSTLLSLISMPLLIGAAKSM